MRSKKVKKSYELASILLLFLIILIILFFKGSSNQLTGLAVGSPSLGPSAEEQACMMECMKCSSPGVGCSGNSEECQEKCEVEKPESSEETSCMEDCILIGCTEYDFPCQTKNQEKCEKECGMLGDRPEESEMSAEQVCITNCVNDLAPGTICGTSSTGETGNDICVKCAESCVYLYEGPCLDDEELKAKQKECETCEHCYGEPIMGDSGEGWECIVDVQCGDASSEFGDNPGTGPGIIGSVGEGIGNFFENIGDFIGNLFDGGSSEESS